MQSKEFKLLKPIFIKVSDLSNRRDPYNVYVKILSVETVVSQEQKIPIAKCVVADETGSANALFRGDDVKLLKQGKVIAIRNGMIDYVKNRISLEIDMFGRITPQQIDIKENSTNNISQQEVERTFGKRIDRNKPRGNRQQRGYRGNRQQREYRGNREDRRNREERGNRQQRGNREERGNRQQRGNREERVNRQQRGNREERGNRQQRGNRGNRGGQGEQKRQRKFQEGERKPAYERPRRQNNEGQKPRERVKFTKIAAIQPGDEGLNIIAKVISVKQVGKNVRLVLGDETGVVNAFMRGFDCFQQNNHVVLFNAEANVVRQHIQLQLSREGGKANIARRQIEKDINLKVDISAKQWIEQN